ncbi:hypothetical protein EV361DRAFT_897274 [Lentinula raphanica]|nr:hypothetical protein EV361DRAFT_897274 [Lentinula raphanica]
MTTSILDVIDADGPSEAIGLIRSLRTFMVHRWIRVDQSRHNPEPTSPAREIVPTVAFSNPGLPDDLFNRLKHGGHLSMHIRIRRRIDIDGKTVTLPLTGTRDNSFSVRKVEPPIDPTEHWTLYLGTAITYDALIPERFAIVPPPKDFANPDGPDHPDQWDRAGLGIIHFSSMQQKIDVFGELHRTVLPKFATHHAKGHNVVYIDNIVRFFEELEKKEIGLKLEKFNYILLYNIFGAMIGKCGSGGGSILPESECNEDYFSPSLLEPVEMPWQGKRRGRPPKNSVQPTAKKARRKGKSKAVALVAPGPVGRM